MSSLTWMPIQENPHEAPQYLEALTQHGTRFQIRPHHNPDNVIDGWSLTLTHSESAPTRDLGRFADVVSAQLHAQQRYDQTVVNDE